METATMKAVQNVLDWCEIEDVWSLYCEEDILMLVQAERLYSRTKYTGWLARSHQERWMNILWTLKMQGY